MSGDDDRFRTPGSRFEHDEVFAIACVPRGAKVDWLEERHVPDETHWLPETIFKALARCSLLGSIPPHQQNLLSRAQCAMLAKQLQTLEVEGDIAVAALLVREAAQRVAASEDLTLLVEGP